MTVEMASFQPVPRMGLEALSPRSELTPELWTNINDEFQERLKLLETEIRRQMPGVQVTTGRTKGENFFLFSYCTFSMPGSAIDPVVVGITFTPAHSDVAVAADASGEQTGDLIFSTPIKTVANSREELLATARTSAWERCQSAAAIVAAIQEASRMVD